MVATRFDFLRSRWSAAIGLGRTTWLQQLLLTLGLSAFFAAVQTFYFYELLSPYAPSLRIAGSIAALIVIFFVLSQIFRRFFSALPKWLAYPLSIFPTLALVFWSLGTTVPVKTAIADMENGQTPIAASSVTAWRASYWAFSLHPHYQDQRPVETISVSVPPGMTTLDFAASKPRASLFRADGSLLGDGVQLNLALRRADGSVEALPPMSLTPSDAVNQGWKKLKVPLAPDKREVAITVTQGPPGSSTAYDLTLVALSFSGPNLSLIRLAQASFGLVLGVSLLIAMAAAVPMLARSRPLRRFAGDQDAACEWATVGLIAVMGILTAYLAVQGLKTFVWRHDAIYYIVLADYLGKFNEDGRWLNLALFHVLKAIPGNIAWFAGLASFGVFAFVCAYGVCKDWLYSGVVALLCLQSIPLYLISTWPATTLPAHILLAVAALTYQRLSLPIFYVVFGVGFVGTLSEYYYLLPLMHLGLFAHDSRNVVRKLAVLIGSWALGFVAGVALALCVKYLVLGNALLEIGAWRRPHYIESFSDFLLNLTTRWALLRIHLGAVLQTPVVAALMMIALSVRLRRSSLPFMAAALIVCTSIVLAHYVITMPIGIGIAWRTVIATFVGVLGFVFLSQRMAAERQLVVALCATGVFLSYWIINAHNVNWFYTVTSTYHRELLRISPLPPSLYAGLIVEGIGARDIEERIIAGQKLWPRYTEPLSVLSFEEMKGEWRWGAAATEAGFRNIVFCPIGSGGICETRLATLKGASCDGQFGMYCVRGVTAENFLVIRFNTGVK